MATYQDPTKKAVLGKYNGVPTSTDAIKLCENVLFSPELKKSTCTAVGDGKGEVTETTVAKDATVKASIKSDVRTPASAGTVPVIDDFWQMSGLAVEVNTDDSTATYTKAPSFPALGTIVDYTDDEKRTITKVRADFTMEFTQGEAVMVTFDINGQMQVKPEIEANPADIVLDTGRKFFVDCIAVNSFDGGVIHFKKATFKMGNEIKENEVKTSVEGGGECEAYKVGSRKPTLVIEDSKEKGVVQHWDDLADGTKRAFYIEMTDYVSGQKLKLDVPVMSYEEVAESIEDTSRIGVSRTFNVDEFSLKYS